MINKLVFAAAISLTAVPQASACANSSEGSTSRRLCRYHPITC